MTSALRKFDVQRSTADTNRRAIGGVVTMGKSISAAASQQVGQTTSGTKLFSEPELRPEFTALILPYTPRQLAKFSGATPEGARHWLDGSRMASLTNTLNIAKSVQSVGAWLAQRSGYERAAQAISTDAVIQWAVEHREAPNQDGALARAILRELASPPEIEKRPPAVSVPATLHERKRA